MHLADTQYQILTCLFQTETGLENMTEYTIMNTEGNELKEGMIVITTGNVNLAHESIVKTD